MESTSAKILKLIRPSRYIETVRFKRKGWARKRVVSNPFQYGEDSLNDDDRSESASVSSPDSYAEETVFESSEEIINVRDERHRSQSLPVNSYAESTLPGHEEDFYENVRVKNVPEKWQNIFESPQVQSSDVSDHLDGQNSSIKVNVDIHSLSGNGAQVLSENVQKEKESADGEKFFAFFDNVHEENYDYEHQIEKSEKVPVIQVQSNDHDEQHDDPKGAVSDGLQQRNPSHSVTNQSFSNSSLHNRGMSPNKKGMTNVNIPEKLQENHVQVLQEGSGSSINDTEDMYVNTREINIRHRSEGSILRDESIINQRDQMSSTPLGRLTQQPDVKEDVYVNFNGQVWLSSDVFHLRRESFPTEGNPMSSTPRKALLNHEAKQPALKEDAMSYLSNFPSPDYLDNDSVYTNVHQMQVHERQENEDFNERMRRLNVDHHEMAYHSEEQYVNVSSMRQHSQQTNVAGTTSVHEESAQNLMNHRMSFRRL